MELLQQMAIDMDIYLLLLLKIILGAVVQPYHTAVLDLFAMMQGSGAIKIEIFLYSNFSPTKDLIRTLM